MDSRAAGNNAFLQVWLAFIVERDVLQVCNSKESQRAVPAAAHQTTQVHVQIPKENRNADIPVFVHPIS